MKKDNGFTLIELLVAVAITGILGVAITSLYIKNLRVNTDQTTVVQMQQNARATADYMVRQIRMAGYNGATTAGAGIITATDSQFAFTMATGTAGALETVDFLLGGNSVLGVQLNGAGGYQPLAEDIHAVGFAYALSNGTGLRTYTTTAGSQAILWAVPDPGGSGNWMRLDSSGDGLITVADDGNNDGTLDLVNTAIGVDFSTIRAVRVSVLGASNRTSQEYVNNQSYVVGMQVLTPNDTIRRRLLTTTVTCRNMGL